MGMAINLGTVEKNMQQKSVIFSIYWINNKAILTYFVNKIIGLIK